MGRGDRKSFKGKITKGTFGNTRKRKHALKSTVTKKVEKSKPTANDAEPTIKKPVVKKKSTTRKKPEEKGAGEDVSQ